MAQMLGWRPLESCYLSETQGQTGSTSDQLSECAKTPWWFWVGAGLAVLFSRPKKK